MRQVLVAGREQRYEASSGRSRARCVLVWGDDDQDAVLAVAESARSMLAHADLIVCPGPGT